MFTCPKGFLSVTEYTACEVLSPLSNSKEMSCGQRVWIMSSWLWRAEMTVSGVTPAGSGVDTLVVAILSGLGWWVGLVGCWVGSKWA